MTIRLGPNLHEVFEHIEVGSGQLCTWIWMYSGQLWTWIWSLKGVARARASSRVMSLLSTEMEIQTKRWRT